MNWKTYYMTTGRDIDIYTLLLKWDHDTRQILIILQFLHFADNSQRSDKGEEYNRLWRLTTVFDTLNEAYAKFYNLSEHLAVDKVTAEFKNRVTFRHTF